MSAWTTFDSRFHDGSRSFSDIVIIVFLYGGTYDVMLLIPNTHVKYGKLLWIHNNADKKYMRIYNYITVYTSKNQDIFVYRQYGG